jgi:hypothetical protein
MYLAALELVARKFELFGMALRNVLSTDSELQFAERFRNSLATLARLLSTTSIESNNLLVFAIYFLITHCLEPRSPLCN